MRINTKLKLIGKYYNNERPKCAFRVPQGLSNLLALVTLNMCLVENINLKTISHTLVILNKVMFLNHGICSRSPILIEEHVLKIKQVLINPKALSLCLEVVSSFYYLV